MMRSCSVEIVRPANWKLVLVKSEGMRCAYGNFTSVRFSITRPQPSAVMIAETRGALRSGR